MDPYLSYFHLLHQKPIRWPWSRDPVKPTWALESHSELSTKNKRSPKWKLLHQQQGSWALCRCQEPLKTPPRTSTHAIEHATENLILLVFFHKRINDYVGKWPRYGGSWRRKGMLIMLVWEKGELSTHTCLILFISFSWTLQPVRLLPSPSISLSDWPPCEKFKVSWRTHAREWIPRSGRFVESCSFWRLADGWRFDLFWRSSFYSAIGQRDILMFPSEVGDDVLKKSGRRSSREIGRKNNCRFE